MAEDMVDDADTVSADLQHQTNGRPLHDPVLSTTVSSVAVDNADMLSSGSTMVFFPPIDHQPSTSFKQSFESCLSRIEAVIDRPPVAITTATDAAKDRDIIVGLMDEMSKLLVCDAYDSPDGVQPNLLDVFLADCIMDRLHAWCIHSSGAPEIMTQHLLSLYDDLIGQSRQRLLMQRQFVLPLFRHLVSCSATSTSLQTEEKLVLVLHQVCVGIARYPSILDGILFENCTKGYDNQKLEDGAVGTVNEGIAESNIQERATLGSVGQGAEGCEFLGHRGEFLLLSLLVPFVHREDVVGQRARDALLLILSVSSTHDSLGRHTVNHSDFCPVLATGLSGLYSSLPRTLIYPSDDWYQFTREDICNGSTDLRMFLNSLEFCNAVALIAHPLVREQLLTYIYNGFLVPVMGPALHQHSDIVDSDSIDWENVDDSTSPLIMSSMEEVIAATTYLDVFLRTITEPGLLKVFLRFILRAKMDEMSILDLLITRISSSATRLCMVTLTLFKTLVELNCEDVMFQLVYKYLVPCTHVMVSQQKSLKDTDIYGDSAEKFLSLIPSCCNLSNSTASLAEFSMIREKDGVATNTHNSDITLSSPHGARMSIPSTPTSAPNSSPFQRSRQFLSKLRHRPSDASASLSSIYSGSPLSVTAHSAGAGADDGDDRRGSIDRFTRDLQGEGSSSPSRCSVSHLIESSYMEYLHAARRSIIACAAACAHWSARYDGRDNTPASTPTAIDSYEAKPRVKVGFNEHPATALDDSSAILPKSDSSSSDIPGLVNISNEPMESCSLHVQSDVAKESGSLLVGCNRLSIIDDTDSGCSSSSSSADDLSGFLLQLTRMKTLGSSVSRESAVSQCDVDSDEDDNIVLDEFEAFLSDVEESCKSTPLTKSLAFISDNINELALSENDLGKCTLPETCVEYGSEKTRSRSGGSVVEIQHSQSVAMHLTDAAAGEASATAVGSAACYSKENGEKSSVVHDDEMIDIAVATSSVMVSSAGDSVKKADVAMLKSDVRNLPSNAAMSMNSVMKNNMGPPSIGPFMTTVLNKLEMMKQNTLYVNLQLTGLVTRLACYPQPLLKSLLLSHTLVFQPSIKSLVQVLNSVKFKLDEYLYTVNERDGMLVQAQQYLIWRDEASHGLTISRRDSIGTVSPAAVVQPIKEKKKNIRELVFGTRTRHQVEIDVTGVRYTAGRVGTNNATTSPSFKERQEAVEKKNAIYCALVLKEFLKELSAISQEHALAASDL